MLRVRDLAKAYSGPRPRPVLRGVDLDLAPGDYVAVMGESGVGKSTLLNLLAGLDRPDAGVIEVDGRDLARLDDDAITRWRRARMGFVFQAFHVLPYLDVRQNVALPLALLGTNAGELQRVAIARALVHRPALVLADEPTGNLDPESAAAVLALLRSEVKRHRAAALLVTHSLAAARTADRILVLTPSGLAPREERADRVA